MVQQLTIYEIVIIRRIVFAGDGSSFLYLAYHNIKAGTDRYRIGYKAVGSDDYQDHGNQIHNYRLPFPVL